MSKSLFEVLVVALGAAFAVAFGVIVVPALLETGDIPSAFAAGFVNPFSSGYSLDVIICAVILFVWIIYERKSLGIKYGWIAIPLSFAPGVATGFAAYLIIRTRQIERDQSVV
ncbi:MAG: DUF2834 domain-containing protein [Henriciella sp.]